MFHVGQQVEWRGFSGDWITAKVVKVLKKGVHVAVSRPNGSSMRFSVRAKDVRPLANPQEQPHA